MANPLGNPFESDWLSATGFSLRCPPLLELATCYAVLGTTCALECYLLTWGRCPDAWVSKPQEWWPTGKRSLWEHVLLQCLLVATVTPQTEVRMQPGYLGDREVNLLGNRLTRFCNGAAQTPTAVWGCIGGFVVTERLRGVRVSAPSLYTRPTDCPTGRRLGFNRRVAHWRRCKLCLRDRATNSEGYSSKPPLHHPLATESVFMCPTAIGRKGKVLFSLHLRRKGMLLCFESTPVASGLRPRAGNVPAPRAD